MAKGLWWGSQQLDGTSFDFTYDSNVHTLDVANIDQSKQGKINITCKGDTEGVWFCMSSDDWEKYSDNTSTDVITGVINNNCLLGVPYGAVIPVKLNGKQRPIFDLDLIDKDQNLIVLREEEEE